MPSAISMVFCRRSSCGCTAISNCSVTRRSWASRRPIEDLVAGLAEDRLADRRGRPGRTPRVTGAPARSRRGTARRPPRDSRGAGRRPGARRGSRACRIEPAHDAEIDRRRCSRRAVDEGVAAVHVGVEEAVAEHLVEERLGALLHDLVADRGRRPSSASRSPIGMPSTRSSVSTRCAVRSQSIERQRDSRHRRRSSRPSSCAAAASMRRSISTRTTSAKARTDDRPASACGNAAACARPARRSSRRDRGRARRRARCRAAAP